MPGRLPTAEDFASHIVLSVVPPPPPPPPPGQPSSTHQAPTTAANALVLLHGHGSPSQAPFATLASQLNLPSTVCLSVRAPNPLPFDLEGWHWGDDVVFDEAEAGAVPPDANAAGVERSLKMLVDGVIAEGLLRKCGFAPRDVQVFGFGAGGGVALAVAAAFEATTASSRRGDEALGGVVNVGGTLPPLPSSRVGNGQGKFKTPLLTLHGSSRSAVTTAAARELKERFVDARFHCWRGKEGDGMPANREEMLPIMRFWGRRLRAGAPEGSVEVG